MESPVMTSASSHHRLRSAVSACAQPTHSYLGSSHLGPSPQVKSHDSGGCFKKFNSSGRNGDSSPVNIPRKSHPTADFSLLRKTHKAACNRGFNHRRPKRNGKEVEGTTSAGLLNLIPKQLVLGSHFLSKLKLSGKLVDYLEKSPRSEGVFPASEKAINGKGNQKNGKRNASNSDSNGKAVSHRHGSCRKGKSKRSGSPGSTGAKDSVRGGGSESSGECPKCGVADPDEGVRDERQEISKWQPKHVVTRRTAQIVREIRNAWQSRVGPSKSVPAEYVRILFKDLQLFPHGSRVSEMLEYAKEYPGEPPLKSVTFGELCRIANLIKSEKVCKVARGSPLPRILDKNEEKRGRKLSKGMSKYEVFLGGSCNPTTWRTDLAIPQLEKMGISYYNPQQVEEWRPELMEVEYHAKENATVMFFVLDNQTRGVSALIEVAHLAGNRRKLILVIQSYTQENQRICDEEITKEEYEDLKRGQEVLQALMKRQGIPVFDNIQVALECTEKILRENLHVQDLQAPVCSSRGDLTTPRQVFEELGRGGRISASDACLALRILTGAEVSVGDLRSLGGGAGKHPNGILSGDVLFDFESFSETVAAFQRRVEGKKPFLVSDPSSFAGSCRKDVYLGGTIENTSWRESLAIPALEEQNLGYFVPRTIEGGRGFTELEAAVMDNAFLLLFVITNTARSIAAMAIAGHYIGKGANVVLCVEHLPENATVGKERLSENAVKDYNRGRMYLMDIAERSDVPVFDDISTAVKFVIKKCRSKQKTSGGK